MTKLIHLNCCCCCQIHCQICLNSLYPQTDVCSAPPVPPQTTQGTESRSLARGGPRPADAAKPPRLCSGPVASSPPAARALQRRSSESLPASHLPPSDRSETRRIFRDPRDPVQQVNGAPTHHPWRHLHPHPLNVCCAALCSPGDKTHSQNT